MSKINPLQAAGCFELQWCRHQRLHSVRDFAIRVPLLHFAGELKKTMRRPGRNGLEYSTSYGMRLLNEGRRLMFLFCEHAEFFLVDDGLDDENISATTDLHALPRLLIIFAGPVPPEDHVTKQSSIVHFGRCFLWNDPISRAMGSSRVHRPPRLSSAVSGRAW